MVGVEWVVMSKIDLDISNLPDTTVSVRDVFGIDTDLRGARLQQWPTLTFRNSIRLSV